MLLAIGSLQLKAQQTGAAGGGEATGSGGNAAYTVGQIFFSTLENEQGSVTQGVQQPFEISVVSSDPGGEAITLFCTAFPNPTTDRLTLRIDGLPSHVQCQAMLFDMQGRMLSQFSIYDSETIISMNHFAPAVYLLRVTSQGTVLKTFRVVKK